MFILFSINEEILSSTFLLGDWPLSRVFLKNEQGYPWFILVPRKANIQEICQLAAAERYLLMEEINQLSLVVNDYFKPDKLNVAAIGNIVAQLHVHVVARYKNDDLWPQGIWQTSMQGTPYKEEQLNELLPVLRPLIELSAKNFQTAL